MIVDHVLFQGKSVQTRMDVHELFGPLFEGVSPDMPMHLARIHSKVSYVPAFVQDSCMLVKIYIVTAGLINLHGCKAIQHMAQLQQIASVCKRYFTCPDTTQHAILL